jgi:hypothetical protein
LIAIAQMYKEGIVSQMEFTNAMFDYFNLSIEEALYHENPLIRSFALLRKNCYDIRTNQK